MRRPRGRGALRRPPDAHEPVILPAALQWTRTGSAPPGAPERVSGGPSLRRGGRGRRSGHAPPGRGLAARPRGSWDWRWRALPSPFRWLRGKAWSRQTPSGWRGRILAASSLTRCASHARGQRFESSCAHHVERESGMGTFVRRWSSPFQTGLEPLPYRTCCLAPPLTRLRRFESSCAHHVERESGMGTVVRRWSSPFQTGLEPLPLGPCCLAPPLTRLRRFESSCAHRPQIQRTRLAFARRGPRWSDSNLCLGGRLSVLHRGAAARATFGARTRGGWGRQGVRGRPLHRLRDRSDRFRFPASGETGNLGVFQGAR